MLALKKILLFAIAFILSLGLKAQCPLSQAVDFTATDCHGVEIHLFDLLDNGQYVLIDFFYTTCGPCQQATPKLVESYYAMGCNMHDVYYIEISDRNNDSQCQTWVDNYGVDYPTIGSTGGGGTISDQYGIGSFPTIILIAPDHSIVIQDLWPINNAQTVINALVAKGLEQHDCNDNVAENNHTVMLYPNPANDLITLKGENLGIVSIYNTLGQKMDEFKADGDELNIAAAKYQNGVYFIKTNEKTMRFVINH